MDFENEFELMCETLKKCRVQVLVENPAEQEAESAEHEGISNEFLQRIQPKALYKYKDELELSYIAFSLSKDGKVAVIGPYSEQSFSYEKILEISEKNSISPKKQNAMEEYFSSVPILDETNPLFLLIDSFLERAWGPNYKIVDNELSDFGFSAPSSIVGNQGENADTLLDMKNMEKRYELENEIMTAVMQGAENKVSRLFSGFSDESFEKRLTDPLRNLKNYSIIMNTLLRKAAQQGGVHPMYIDRVSSLFATKIEQIARVEQIKDLMGEMFVSYCRLVNNHTQKGYSEIIKSAITIIETNLSSELSLSSLAKKLKVSSGYLSALFKKETGKTITEYIRDKRLANAVHLLRSTNLQIQTIALHCGMVDVQYFSKIFKKQLGKTPTQVRQEGQGE